MEIPSIQTNYTEIENLKVCYHVAGENSNPVLVFLHAWGAQTDWLPPIISELSKCFYVIAPEHPGLLRSETPLQWSFDWHAKVLDELLKRLDIQRPIILVGNSFGGGIATIYALQNPSKVKELILVDSVLPKEFPSTPFVKAIHGSYTSLISSRLVPLSLKRFLVSRYLGTPPNLLTKEELAKKAQMLQSPRDLIVDYKAISVPVVFLWGKQDRFVHPISYARQIVKAIPTIKLIEYTGSVPTIYKEPGRISFLIKNV